MKLLVDAHCFDYKTSEGITTYLRGMYTELVSIAPEIEFYFVARDIDNIRRLFGVRPNVHYVALESDNRIYRLLFEIPALVKKYGIDYAHFQYTSPLIKNCKTIVTLHDILFLDYPHYFPFLYRLTKGVLFRVSAKRADLLLTVSDYSKSRIAKHYHLKPDEIVVTPNAVSDSFTSTDTEEARQFVGAKGVGQYILYVSRIEPRKNHIRLLKEYLRLKLWEKGYDLVFIGKQSIPVPDFEEQMKALPEEAKSHIHLFNQVAYEELLYWYKAASLFIYPSLAEGFGIPPLEAAIAEVPCICSDKTAMSEYDFFGENLIDVEDEARLDRLIMQNLESPQQCHVEAIRAKILAKYDWRVSARTLYRCLILKE